MANSGATKRRPIQVDDTTWVRLNALKKPGQSFNSVVVELLAIKEAKLRIDKK
jgi:predicted CopG family antitoxin